MPQAEGRKSDLAVLLGNALVRMTTLFWFFHCLDVDLGFDAGSLFPNIVRDAPCPCQRDIGVDR